MTDDRYRWRVVAEKSKGVLALDVAWFVESKTGLLMGVKMATFQRDFHSVPGVHLGQTIKPLNRVFSFF